jgi:tetratricopeptide (TPR) repeat protein
MEWTPDYETSAELAYRMAHKAVDLARRELDPKPSLPYALEQWGYVLLYRRQHEEAHNAAEEAVQHSPSYADGYALGALVLIYSGKPEEALRKTQDAIARNPKYPFFYDYHRGQAHYVSGYLTAGRDPGSSRQHFDEAEKYLREALRKNGNFLPARAYLMAVLSELRRQDEAKNEAVVLRKADHHRDLREFQDYLHRNTPYKDQAIETHLTTVWSNLWREAGTRP